MMTRRSPQRDQPDGLERRFLRNLEALGLLEPGVRLLVAVSGGRDSVVLLYLLRFHIPGLHLSVAHLDHAMRPGSSADARWVAGLCRAWGLKVMVERVKQAPRTEDQARRARYAFLRRAAAESEATHIATAHHADDQAETVLFRVLRGTGPTGLAGIASASSSGLVRPLLPFWRRELAQYARAAGLRWREDPSNRSLDPARNRIRHEILPLIESMVAPGARRSLVRLAETAGEMERAWEAVAAPLASAVSRRDGEALLLARARLRDYDPAVATRILRNVLRQFGAVLDRAGTRTALQFISEAPSGRELQLPGGLRIFTEFETARVERLRQGLPDEPLMLASPPQPGAVAHGCLRIGGRELRVAWQTIIWGETPSPDLLDQLWSAALRLDALQFPLLLRRWEPGDRIRTASGTRTLKKLFTDRRIPRSQRSMRPVLVDRAGRVLWIAGVQLAADVAPDAQHHALFLTLADD
jgi:tRNA(Ile)-lysidine synthase